MGEAQGRSDDLSEEPNDFLAECSDARAANRQGGLTWMPGFRFSARFPELSTNENTLNIPQPVAYPTLSLPKARPFFPAFQHTLSLLLRCSRRGTIEFGSQWFKSNLVHPGLVAREWSLTDSYRWGKISTFSKLLNHWQGKRKPPLLKGLISSSWTQKLCTFLGSCERHRKQECRQVEMLW